MNYEMTCSCGDTITVVAGSREEAVEKMADLMEPQMEQHMAERHGGAPAPDNFHEMLEFGVHESDSEY